MNNYEKMIRRLNFLLKKDSKDPISELKTLDLVSAGYDFRNLATDLWYLGYRDSQRCVELSDFHDCTDPIKSMWLNCLILALFDAKLGRPCDLGAWKYDSAPMGIATCTKEVHICAPAARAFLLSLEEDAELLAGISPGTIRAILGERAPGCDS